MAGRLGTAGIRAAWDRCRRPRARGWERWRSGRVGAALAVGLVGGSTILFAVLYLAHGLSARTSAALVGTLVSMLAAG